MPFSVTLIWALRWTIGPSFLRCLGQLRDVGVRIHHFVTSKSLIPEAQDASLRVFKMFFFFSKKHSWDAQNRAFCLSGWVPATGHNKEHWWRHMLHMNFHGFRDCSTCCCGILKPTGARDVSRNITFIFRFKIFFLPHDYHFSMLHVTCADDWSADPKNSCSHCGRCMLPGTHLIDSFFSGILGGGNGAWKTLGRPWVQLPEDFQVMEASKRWPAPSIEFDAPVLDKFRRVDESQKAVRKLSSWLPHWIRLLYIYFYTFMFS